MVDEAIRYVVILRKPEQLAFPALASALARHRGCPALDAIPTARSCWGILEEASSGAAAQDLAAALSAAGFESLALPQNLVEDHPPVAAVVRAEFGPQTPVFFTADGVAHPVAGAELLCAAILKRSVTHTIKVQKDIGLADKALQVGLLMATGLPIRTSRMRKEVDKTVVSSELWGVLDIVHGTPPLCLRVLSESFDYSCLGGEKTYDTLGNLRVLARRLASLWPRAGRSRGLRLTLEGGPQRDMGYESLADLERESRWLLTLRGLQS